ncbi:hypothetical protein [Cytobacillus dafuensis]|uniref:DUF2273 domain-containing protein n=1 Tax=Cytobacillus dafuensis TaxID=1742359 RepID=A0A5B8Z517_CYTDA|nr:hypothetical protein [Cytobacillus dafuensis]QED46426.1 hypothetical protein FSZ17_03605 [Cytobacillus dafuensis]
MLVTTALTIALFTLASSGGIIAAGFTGFGAAMVAKDVLDSSGYHRQYDQTQKASSASGWKKQNKSRHKN